MQKIKKPLIQTIAVAALFLSVVGLYAFNDSYQERGVRQVAKSDVWLLFADMSRINDLQYYVRPKGNEVPSFSEIERRTAQRYYETYEPAQPSQ